ncbi:MAG: VanZ family protein [Desulfobulbaceae bacterium]|nr:VanZ family protein [Desulfobulbaceae bacterium]
MSTIFFLSHTPGDNLPSLKMGMDKLAHATAYAVLAASILFALYPWAKEKSLLRIAAVVLFLSFLYGLTDEFHQSFIPNRSPDWRDIVADTCGAGMVVLFWAIWCCRMHSQKHTLTDRL